MGAYDIHTFILLVAGFTAFCSMAGLVVGLLAHSKLARVTFEFNGKGKEDDGVNLAVKTRTSADQNTRSHPPR